MQSTSNETAKGLRCSLVYGVSDGVILAAVRTLTKDQTDGAPHRNEMSMNQGWLSVKSRGTD